MKPLVKLAVPQTKERKGEWKGERNNGSEKTETRLETHRSETETRPRCWEFCHRQDRNETIVRLETGSSSWDRDVSTKTTSLWFDISKISIYHFWYRYIISYHIAETNIDFFDISRYQKNIAIYRNIFWQYRDIFYGFFTMLRDWKKHYTRDKLMVS